MIRIKAHKLVDNINKTIQKERPGCTLWCIEYSLDRRKPDSHLVIDDIHKMNLNNLKKEKSLKSMGKVTIPPGGRFHIPIKKKGEVDFSYLYLTYEAYLHQSRLLKIDDLLG